MEQTLRQVCTGLKLSRRAVQGYEQAGLVAPSGKNKYGYLLYGEPEQGGQGAAGSDREQACHPRPSGAGLWYSLDTCHPAARR